MNYGWKLVLTAAVMQALSFLLVGYKFPGSDHSIQIPLGWARNHSLYPGDPMVAQSAYQSVIWELITRLSDINHIEILALSLHFAVMFGTFLLLSFIAYHRLDQRRFWILPLFLVYPVSGFASAPFHDNWLSLRNLSLLLVLPAVFFHLRAERPNWVPYAITGVSFNLHPISSILVATMFAVSDLLRLKRSQEFRKGLSQSVRVMAAWIVGAFPLLLSTLFAQIDNAMDASSSSMLPSDHWLTIMTIRSSHHVFPTAFSIGAYLSLVSYFLATLTVLRFVRPKLREKLIGYLIATVLLLVIGTVCAELVPLFPIMELQLLRSSRFLPLWAGIAITAAWATTSSSSGKSVPMNTLNRFQHGLLLCAFVSMLTPAIPGLAIPFLALLGATQIPWLMERVPSSCLLLRPHAPLSERSTKITQEKATGAVWIPRKLSEKRLVASVAFVTLLIAGQFTVLAVTGHRPFSSDYLYSHQSADWVDVQEWAKTNTERDAVFLTPPQWEGFRIHSQRPIVGSWKDGTLAFFNQTYAEVWWSRMLDLGYSESNYDNYGWAEYVNIDLPYVLQTYNVSYVVTSISHAESYSLASLEWAYENPTFLVLKVV